MCLPPADALPLKASLSKEVRQHLSESVAFWENQNIVLSQPPISITIVRSKGVPLMKVEAFSKIHKSERILVFKSAVVRTQNNSDGSSASNSTSILLGQIWENLYVRPKYFLRKIKTHWPKPYRQTWSSV